ncbi:hypothetical protein [Polaromonas sp. CG_9.11]|uniref:hypothetical protein n=1 Tax=Polaromonas sp. CG_9.11 TaxID=2787730 RepID=UPI0018CB4C71|nr:hypothetical protein [Polaromonas sp. CG_9.11]MBG6075354.1 hypothetical protein [Polaromonas sp. CG_9.11]
MKSNDTAQNSNVFVSNLPPKAGIQSGYDASLLPFPKSTLPKKRQKISDLGSEVFKILTRTGVKFRDQDLRLDYNLTEKTDAFSMLITNRDFDVHQTAPQSIATAMIISAIALQAEKFRTTFRYAIPKRLSFEDVLEAMDKIACVIGPLADYRIFEMNVETAATGIHQCRDQDAALFDKDGKCNKAVLQSQAEKLSVVRGEGPVETIEFINDAKPIEIARAVKRAGVFDFSVGTVPVNNVRFMNKLEKHLKQQRLFAAKAH